MTAPELLQSIEARGGVASVKRDGGAAVLNVSPRSLALELLPDLRRHKFDLLELLARETSAPGAHRWASTTGDDPTGAASAAAPTAAPDELPDVPGVPTFAAPDDFTAPDAAAAPTGSAAAPDVPVWAAPGLSRQQQWRAARLDGQRQARERRAIEAQSTD